MDIKPCKGSNLSGVDIKPCKGSNLDISHLKCNLKILSHVKGVISSGY